MAAAPAPFLPVPALPAPAQAAGLVYVWGCGNFGQYGLGPDHIGEFPKPRKHTWAEEKAREGVLRGGVVGIEAGGMHSLFLDGEGNVRRLCLLVSMGAE